MHGCHSCVPTRDETDFRHKRPFHSAASIWHRKDYRRVVADKEASSFLRVALTKRSCSLVDAGYSCQYTLGTVLFTLEIMPSASLSLSNAERQLHSLQIIRIPDSFSLMEKSYGDGLHS